MAFLNETGLSHFKDKLDSTYYPLTGGSLAGSISAAGNISASGSTGFSGKGTNLTALNASNISSGTLAIARGGTGQTTRASATNGLFSFGLAPISSTDSDTPANWGAYGPGYAWYSMTGKLTDQPSQYGFVLNIPYNLGSELHQIWMTQTSGNLAHRGGNSNGWSGTWRTILDSSNYSSYCASSSHTHSYLPLSGGTVSGNVSITGSSGLTVTNASRAGYFLINTSIDRTTTPTTNTWGGNLSINDKNGKRVGVFEPYIDTSGYTNISMGASVRNSADTAYQSNTITCGSSYATASTYKYSITSPGKFREALGLGNATGALPLANGGTGGTKISCLASGGAAYNIGIRAGTASPSSSGTVGMIYIQYSS